MQGVSYQRAVGAMVSLAGELYVFGGFSTSRFLEMTGILREDDPFMVKLNKDTHMWEPVTLAGAPGASWCQGFVNAKGNLISTARSLCLPAIPITSITTKQVYQPPVW